MMVINQSIRKCGEPPNSGQRYPNILPPPPPYTSKQICSHIIMVLRWTAPRLESAPLKIHAMAFSDSLSLRYCLVPWQPNYSEMHSITPTDKAGCESSAYSKTQIFVCFLYIFDATEANNFRNKYSENHILSLYPRCRVLYLMFISEKEW